MVRYGGVLLACLAAACSARKPAADAPPPYTVKELRAGCADGRVARFLIETSGRNTYRTYTYAKGDEEGCDLIVGATHEPERRRRTTWEEMRRQATFPAHLTKVGVADIATPAGSFSCKLYTVREGTIVERYYFATALPGPPVRHVRMSGDRQAFAMTLIENKP